MYVGNDTSHKILADNFARNRDQNFVQPFSKKWLCYFFETLERGAAQTAPRFHTS